MMNILAWLRNALGAIRGLLVRIGASLSNTWASLRTRGAAAGSGQGSLGQRLRTNLGKITSATVALWQRTVQWLGAARTRLASGPVGGLFMRLGTVGTAIWGWMRRGMQWAGRGFAELWQLVRPLFGRLGRSGAGQANLIIRKIGVKRRGRYTLSASPLHQLLADVALALAIVLGLGLWPDLQFWAAQNLPAAIAAHTWVISAIAALTPLLVVYQRWQQGRQTEPNTAWDILTLTCAAVGVLVLLFAGAHMFTALTAADPSLFALGCAVVAAFGWMYGESANVYAILIRRPYKLAPLISLGKSVVFVLSSWLILTYLLVVNLLDNIQLDSATFLAAIFSSLAGVGVLLAIGLYLVHRFNWRVLSPKMK